MKRKIIKKKKSPQLRIKTTHFQGFTKESTIVKISTCWEKRLDFSLDCFHNNQANVCSLPIVFSGKKCN